MPNFLYDLLVDKSKTETDEIKRLAKFRGLKEAPNELDIHLFLNKYFSKDSAPKEEKYYRGKSSIDKWAKSFACSYLPGVYVDPLRLDPFVARYVNASNMIGAKTYASCDGWHEYSNNVLYIDFRERNSKIWHKIMCSLYLGNNEIKWMYRGNRASISLPKTDNGKIEVYKALNRNAEYFEEHRVQLIDLKRRVIETIKGKEKNNLADEELEQYLIDVIKSL